MKKLSPEKLEKKEYISSLDVTTNKRVKSNLYNVVDGFIGGSDFLFVYNIDENEHFRKDGKIKYLAGVINSSGKEIIPTIYDTIYFEPESNPYIYLGLLKEDKILWGVAEETGKILEECKYELNGKELKKYNDEKPKYPEIDFG